MKTIKTLLAGALLGITLTACDSVAEPDRFIPTEIVPQRAILLEEFTGQLCRNCPDGHAAIHDITAVLGDSVVAVGIHGGNLALPAPTGLMTTESDNYYKAAGSPSQPSATIDMATSPLQVDMWGTTINKLIMTPTPFTVIARPQLSADRKTYDIDVAFSSGHDYQGKLLVWIVENDIVAMQDDHGKYIMDYVHNHVFRASANGQWGDDVTLAKNKPQYRSYSVDVDRTWNPDNIYVVAFLYNDAGVAQVTQSK